MGQKPRVRRPPLDRTEPTRSWGSVLGSAASASPGGTHAPDMHAANRVVEEYLRAGLDGAAKFSRAGGHEQPRNSAERILQSTADLATSCFELLTRMTPFAAPVAVARPAEDYGTRPQPTASQSAAMFGPSVTLESRGGRPTSISIALQGGVAGGVKVQRLHPRSVDAPPLTGISVTRQPSGHIVVRVEAGATAPPDSYDGVLLDATSGLPVGTLSVTIENSADASRARRRARTVKRDRKRTRR